MTATPALLAAAAGVALGHAILPDHWVPLAVLSRTRNYPLARVARVSTAAAVTHVAVSLVLGGVIILVGLQFRSVVEHTQNLVIGGLLIITGLALAAVDVIGGSRHRHHVASERPSDPDHEAASGSVGTERNQHQHRHPHPGDGPRRFTGLGVVVPFGAAASPDLTILPVFLAATAVGVGASVGALAVFSIVTIATIVGLTVSATVGGYQLGGRWLDRWGNAVTALVLVIVGSLVLSGLV